MKPIDQTLFGGTTAPPAERGNCFTACVASIFELRLDQVPHFVGIVNNPDDWYPGFERWLRKRGFYYVEVNDWPESGDWLKRAGYYLAHGVGPRGHDHSTVEYAGKLVHDPHPSRAGLVERKQLGFLVPLDPAARLERAA